MLAYTVSVDLHPPKSAGRNNTMVLPCIATVRNLKTTVVALVTSCLALVIRSC
jgi:hypothetical protein